MSAFSNYLETKIVDFWLRSTTQTPPSDVYLALFENDPGEEGTGTETAYTNYARQISIWTPLSVATGQTKNDAAITFPANGNSSSEVTISHAAILDSATGGNMLLYGPLASPKTLAVGDVLSFAANALTLTID